MNQEVNINKTNITNLSAYQIGFFSKMYGWMSAGLLTTFFVSFGISIFVENQIRYGGFDSRSISFLFLTSFLVQLFLVFIINRFGQKLGGLSTSILFIIFSISMGFTLGFLFLNYELRSIIYSFFATFLTFAVMSFIGLRINRDLSRLGIFLYFSLFGVILATIVNFFASIFIPEFAQPIFWILNYITLFIFIALTAYDTNKLKDLSKEAYNKSISNDTIAIQGALDLYLDFINIFIRLLSIFGRRR